MSNATESLKIIKRGPNVQHVESCADEVMNTRDFCGNEQETISDFQETINGFCMEHHLLNSNVFQDCVIGTVNYKRWKQSQIEAGEKPKYHV